ncbi:hypothetical protein B0H34DRAFT_671632 [Crassisporium funariophilum]|nr:hypothetical protein B0H34DRAFT_671632 [Crassisporium funariophilum]
MPMRPTDADDSIVLSDLVRTGEASRLRRRGAMRIDHSLSHRPTSPNLVIVERPSWDSDYDQDSALALEGHLNRLSSSRYPRRQQRRSSRRYGPYAAGTSAVQQDQPDEYVYSLVCGAAITNFDPVEAEPFKPSILPLYPPVPSSSQTTVEQSTGCGAIIHMQAAPRSRVGIWTACSAASSDVVPLDASYFDSWEAAKFIRNSCGCIKEGVGCAVCGNPLGMRYIPCKAASDNSLCSRSDNKSQPGSMSNPLRGPEGPQYWQASSVQNSSHMVYTFFPQAVASTPTYEFPPIKPTRRQRAYSDVSFDLFTSPPPVPPGGDYYGEEAEINAGLQWERTRERADSTWDVINGDEIIGAPNPTSMFLDRFSASSPTPMSDGGDDIPALIQPPRARTHARSLVAPGVYSASGTYANLDPQQESFYQQQIQGAWDRERREQDRRRSLGQWEFDPDGDTEVWGVWGAESWGPSSFVADLHDADSPDKIAEGVMHMVPER